MKIYVCVFVIIYMYVCACIYMYARVCVCVCVFFSPPIVFSFGYHFMLISTSTNSILIDIIL